MEALLLCGSYVLIHHYHFTGWREANPDHIHARWQRAVLYHTPREVVHPNLFFRHTLDVDMAVGHADVDVAFPDFIDALCAIRDEIAYDGGVAGDGKRIGVVDAARAPVVETVAVGWHGVQHGVGVGA